MGRFAPWIVLLAAIPSHAFDICKYLKNGGVSGCNGFKVSSGGSVPSQGAAHQMNPGSIPAKDTPFGLETLYSLPPSDDSTASAKYNFSLVKGFKRMGTGVSTGSEDTFFSHSYIHASQETMLEEPIRAIYDANDTIVRTVNLGTSFRIPLGNASKVFEPSLGVLTRYNVPMKQWGWGLGLDFSTGMFSAGISYVTEPNEVELRNVPMVILMAGFGWGPIRLDYASLRYQDGLLLGLPASIMTVSFNWKRLIVFAGHRISQNFQGEYLTDQMYGAQFLITKHFSLGALMNYLPGRYSIGAQIFL